ncbi:MAG: hypothetical protein IPM64_17400 [Phycisphaerales bacterium]|nr:hypothetical protein [Phycisphaerales bacterium]
MLSLELSAVTATLENLNPRVEKIGAEKLPAADLKISCAQSADVLAHFSPTLKAFLFDADGPRDLADGMTVRDPHLGYPLSRDEEMTGATVTIGFGVGSPMVFPDCRVNQFRITPMEGGTVVLGFRVQCRPDEKQIGKLYQLQETGVEFTLEPADLPEMK